MRILVTGGAGFIASQVADAYLTEGHQVAVLDNLSNGRRENLPAQADFFEVDIEDAEDVRRVMAEWQPEIVNHHAAQVDVRVSVAEPLVDARRNILGSLNVIEAAREVGVKKLIYANSGGAGYGDPDPERLPCAENTPVHPISPYGVSKMAVEYYLYSRHITHGLPYVALRYSNVYGPRQSFGEAGVCAIFIHQMLKGEQPTIFGDGTQERDYTFVGDVVQANVLALQEQARGAYNVGTGQGTTTREVFEAVKAATGYAGEPLLAEERPGEIQRVMLSPEKISRELGWQPSVTFVAGIAKTVDWMRAQ